MRPHVVVELAMAGPTDEDTETGGEAGKKHSERRLRNDQFDVLYHHNDTLSDAVIHLVRPCTRSPTVRASRSRSLRRCPLSTHLHLRLVYRGYTPPPPDKIEARQTARPPTATRPPTTCHTPHRLTPRPVRMRLVPIGTRRRQRARRLTSRPRMHSPAYVLLEQLAAGVQRGGWAEVAVREERGEEAEGRGRRAGFCSWMMGWGVGVRAGQGRVEWMPSVWESRGRGGGVGWCWPGWLARWWWAV